MKWLLFFIGWGVVIGLIFLVAWGSRPLPGAGQRVEIPVGMSRTSIAKTLQDKHIIRSRLSFLTLLALLGGQVQAGTYTLNPNHNVAVILEMLKTGRNQIVTLTIPEGWRREQIAQELDRLGFDGAGFLKQTTDKEGYLFPDTYFLQANASVTQILDKFNQNYIARTKDLNPTRDQLILASIVEREAKTDDERALIAGIYTNRLNQNMALQADPTVQYAKDTNTLAQGTKVTQFWGPITVADYQGVASPYNTYLHPGLPPGPIANPGLKSMTAAVHPASTEALFFFHTKDGKIITSRTAAEHAANQKKYL